MIEIKKIVITNLNNRILLIKVTRFTNTVITQSATAKFKHKMQVELFLSCLDIKIEPITNIFPILI